MVLSRRLLRVAALGAVFALALAGTALAETYTWKDSVLSGSWNESSNWTKSGSGTGYPGAADTAIFTKDAEISTLGGPSTVDELKFTDNATLTLNGGSGQYLEVKKITVAGGKNATIDSRSEISISLGANSPIEVGSGATLTIEYGGVFSGVGELQLSGGGTLDLKISVDDVTGLKITGGSTLLVNCVGALPNLSGPEVSIANGNLTLNQPLHAAITTITVTNGVLTVADAGYIGNGSDSNPDSTVELGAGGRLELGTDLTLKELKTAEGSKIDTNGKPLTVKPAGDLDLKAAVTGNLNLKMAAGKTAMLFRDVKGTVGFEGKNPAPTLALASSVRVGTIDITGVLPSKLRLEGGNTVDVLKFDNAAPFALTTAGGESTIGQLAPASGATLNLEGNSPLTVNGGPSVSWNVNVGAGSDLRVKGKELLSGTVTATFGTSTGGGALTLPSGSYTNLKLKTENAASKIRVVDEAPNDRVLKVKELDLGTADLVMEVPTTWKTALKKGQTVTLLEADTVTGTHTVTGDPAENDFWKVEPLTASNKKLVLTAKKDLAAAPVLTAEATGSGNERRVNVKVAGDVSVKADSWNYELVNVVAPGSVSVSRESGTQKAASFKVTLGSGFKSGTLRVTATNESAPVTGSVNVDLKTGASDTPAAPSIDSSSWGSKIIASPDAQGNMTVQLTAALTLDGTPKSLDVVASGMKEKPKAELLDGSGKVVVTSSVPTVSATARTYRLRLTCRTTKADIDSGRAAIEKVLVTMGDGKVHTITVNKKLKDIAKPGGNPGQPDNPGTPGQPGNPGTPGQPDNPGGTKSSSGGGCDAGLDSVALLALLPLCIRRRR